jgi:hypothetical protein
MIQPAHMAGTATYVYCVVEADSMRGRSGVPPGLPGGGRPAAVRFGRRLYAVVSDVPMDTYGAGAIEAGLQNLAWVSEIALAHEAVVERFAARRTATVLPMKLFTMFTSADRAIASLQAQRPVLASALRRLRGCSEWGVRAVRAPHPSRAASPSPQGIVSGAMFLAAKRRERDAAVAATREAAEAIDAVIGMLAPLSRDQRRRTDHPPAAVPPLLDAAFLVPDARRTRFRAAARRAAAICREAGIQLTLSGPWPAYNFVQSVGPAR